MPKRTCASPRSGARSPRRWPGRAAGVFHLSQGYEGQFSFYRDRWPEIEAAYRLPARKLAISETLRTVLESRGYGPVANVGQVFESQAYLPGPPRSAADPPVVLLVGPSEADVKGVGIALDGLELFRRRGGHFRLRRIATTPIASAEASRGLTEEYHHHLAPERMPFAYRASDVFLGPSRSQEGFGLPALEALACGVPCLLSDTPGHREMAGEAAWYFSDGDAANLAEALPLLLVADARERARQAGPRAASRFDTGRVAERLEAEFLAAAGSGTA